MKSINAVLTAACLCLCSTFALAQDTGKSSSAKGASSTANLGLSSSQMEALNSGWSAKKSLLGKNVVNDQNEKIGKIDDLVLTQEKEKGGFAIIGTGGFVGMGKHDVAVPMDQLKAQGDNLVLSGATKDALKALPAYDTDRNKKK